MQIGDWLTLRDIPQLDNELLLGHILGLTRAQLLTRHHLPIGPKALLRLEAGAARLRAGEPLAYVIGRRGFWNSDLLVNPAVLIPRPETEHLVERALEHTTVGARVLDLGTGSGAVAIAIAAERPAARVTAVDISSEALNVASSNANENAVMVRLLKGAWFAPVPAHETFDVIVSNPPYVADNDPALANLSYEPQLALRAGPDGLRELSHICGHAPARLAPGGWLLLEHGYDQGDSVRKLMVQSGLSEVTTSRDLAGHERITGGRAG